MAITVAFFLGGVTEKKKAMTIDVCPRLLLWWCYKEKGWVAFFFVFEIKKKTTTTSITFFDGFVVKKMMAIVITFFGGFATKKVMATMSSPSSMVVVLWKRQWQQAVSFFFFSFFFLWSFWSNSLELTINNEMVFFLMLKLVMAKGRRLKGGDDLEVHKQNVASS